MPDRPNILVISTDQHRGDALGIEGHPVLQTPYLDHLAVSGVRFTRAYSECPVCVPARRTMITGRTPANHGVLCNAHAPLPFATLPGTLREAGYRTHLVGKAHWGPNPLELGFDSAVKADGPTAWEPDSAYTRFLIDNGITFPAASDAHGCPVNGFPARPWHLDENLHFSSWCAHEAVRFLEERDTDQPFFMMVNFLHPHQPVTPPAFYYHKYMAMDLPEPFVGDWARVYDEPQRGLNPEPWRIAVDPIVMKQNRAAYYGSIEHIDAQISRFLTRRILPANTIVVFLSDHGEMLGDHQWLRKRSPWEPSARVPFLMRFPESMDIPQEQVIDKPIAIMDLMPTLLDAAGVDCPAGVDGKSLLPIIRNSDAPWREFAHGECSALPTTNSGMQYLTDGRRKYCWFPGTGDEQLFDLVHDPDEMHDLSYDPASADELATWRTRLAEILEGRPEGFVRDGDLQVLGGPTSAHLSSVTGG